MATTSKYRTISAKRYFKYFKNFVSRFWALIFWVSFICFIFWNTYKNFKIQPQYYYLRLILGCSLCISRGSAPVLTVCSLLIFLPVCRSIHTILHCNFAKLSTALLAAWLSRVKIMHVICAATLIIFSFIHTGAHLINAVNFSNYYTELYPEINFAKFKGQNPALLICTWTGYSGIAMLIILLLMAVTSTSKFRLKHFNAFYITHHLFFVYLILLSIHPFSGVLKEQTNINQHIPGCILSKNTTVISRGSSVYCKSPPKFKCIPAQSWIWVLVSLIIYIIEIGYRKYKNKHIEAIQACHVINKAIHLRLKCLQNFKITPGQYILLQCHKISNIEWHPFTVTKCPSKECQSFELLINVRGDWTKSLYNLVKTPFSFDHKRSYISRLHHKPLKFSVDGPFSSPMQTITHHKYVICVAAGIGITSFVATLRFLLLSQINYPKRLHLIWITKDPNQILWYSELLWDLQKKFWDNNQPDRFQIQLFVTQGHRNIFKNKLTSRVNFGRPNWKEEFRIFNLMYKTLFLFCCGPNSLKFEVKKRCHISNIRGFTYNFIQEGF